MTWTKCSLQQLTLSFTTSLALAGFVDSSTRVQASNSLISTEFNNQPRLKSIQGQAISRLQASLRFILPLPPNRKAPGRRRGAASRGECPSVSKPLTALVPATEEPSGGGELAATPSKTVLGLTTAERPTFWFYVPYELTSERSIEFVLLDEQNRYVYKTAFRGNGTLPGVVGLPLSPTAEPLEVDQMYHWYFLVNCDADDLVFVEGWIQRVAPSPALAKQLEVATPKERVDLYAANGIWYEALTTLAELYRAAPEDTRLAADWVALLQTVDLGNITSEPIMSISRYQELTLPALQRD